MISGDKQKRGHAFLFRFYHGRKEVRNLIPSKTVNRNFFERVYAGYLLIPEYNRTYGMSVFSYDVGGFKKEFQKSASELIVELESSRSECRDGYVGRFVENAAGLMGARIVGECVSKGGLKKIS